MIWLFLTVFIFGSALLHGQHRIRGSLLRIHQRLNQLPGNADGPALTELADEIDRDTAGLEKSVSDNTP